MSFMVHKLRWGTCELDADCIRCTELEPRLFMLG